MSAEFLGAVTVGQEIPGFTPTFLDAASTLATLATSLRQFAEALRLAKSSIRIPAVASPASQIEGMQLTLAFFGLQNPVTYVEGLVAGMEQAIEGIGLQLPTVQVSAQVEGINLAIAGLLGQVAAIDAALAVLDPIIDQASSIADAAANSAAASSVLAATLGVSGLYSFSYSGPLAALGSSLDAVTPLAGIPGTSPVTVAIVLAPNAAAAATNALVATFRVV